VPNKAKLGQPGISGEQCQRSPLCKTCETKPISASGPGDGSAIPAILGPPDLLAAVNRMGIIGARANDRNTGSDWED
jgi:hypothetical protein